MEKLTPQEENIMRCFWKLGPGQIRDIIGLQTDPQPYTTVASIANNLRRKGYLMVTKRGNSYEYAPLIPESAYKREFVGGVVDSYFHNSYKEMVSFFAKEQKISVDELKEIIQLIDKGTSEP